MPNLMAFFGLDGSKFAAGLDKAVAEAAKKGPSIEKSLMGALKQSSIFNAIASPIGAACTAAVGFFGLVIAKVEELRDRAKEIKIGAAQTGLSQDQFQNVFNAAQGSGASTEAIPKAILKIAEAQEKVKNGGEGAAKALEGFSALGITLGEIQSNSYQDLFLKISESMHVAQLSGEQLTAGAELMGKGFESLLPAFQRGFHDPVDQMNKLSDEEITKLNNVSKSVAILKATWQGGLQNAANLLIKVTGAGNSNLVDDPNVVANEKRLQGILDQRQAKKAAAANADRQAELSAQKNLTKAGEIDKRVAEEERVAKLRSMPAPERLAELKKETAELERQAAILEAKLRTEKDAADAPALAELRAQISRRHLEEPELSKQPRENDKLSVTANQRIGAFVGGGVADRHLQTAQNTEKHAAATANYLQLIYNQAQADRLQTQRLRGDTAWE